MHPVGGDPRWLFPNWIEAIRGGRNALIESGMRISPRMYRYYLYAWGSRPLSPGSYPNDGGYLSFAPIDYLGVHWLSRRWCLIPFRCDSDSPGTTSYATEADRLAKSRPRSAQNFAHQFRRVLRAEFSK
jgi:hypothetical protein